MSNQLLDGKTFNDCYREKQLIKLTNKLENHNGYQFQTGLNIDSNEFNPSGECQRGGIYFCLWEKLSMWLNYSRSPMFYARLVTIPDDAKVWIEKDKFKTDRLILGDRVKIGDLTVWNDSSYCLEACKFDGLVLQYIKNQTPEMCLISVRQNFSALQYVLEPNPGIVFDSC